MTAAKTIAGIIPMAMGLSLLDYDVKALNKKKQTTKSMLKLGVTNLVGVSLIGATSDMAAQL